MNIIYNKVYFGMNDQLHSDQPIYPYSLINLRCIDFSGFTGAD